MPSHLELPSHLHMESSVRERFERIRSRPAVLEVERLEKRYDTREGSFLALSDVSFEVRHREFICVIGRSGCGKSTLIRTVAGLEQPTGGGVLVDGKPVAGPGPDRGMVFQSYTLFPWLTVRKNVMFGLKMRGLADDAADAEVSRWIDLVGLKGFEDRYPDQLSGGMRQRVAIARALANRPRILLMDEPFGALDAQTRCQMQSYLLQIWRKVDVTVMFITHDLDEAIYLADRIVVLGRNPGHVQEIIEVPVPRPRRSSQLFEPAFLATRRRLEELIHPREEMEEELDVPVGGVVDDMDDAIYA
jgi:NitT/TauT family transport system ATP-binding protein